MNMNDGVLVFEVKKKTSKLKYLCVCVYICSIDVGHLIEKIIKYRCIATPNCLFLSIRNCLPTF